MKINKALLFLVIGAMLLLLTGCFQVTEEYWVNADGSGKMHFEIGVSEALLSMGESNPIDGSQIFSDEGLDAQNPYLKNIKTSENSNNGMHYYVIDADITDFSRVFENSSSQNSGFQARVEKLSNGNYLFKRTMDLATLNAGQDASLGLSDGTDMSNMVAAMFSDKYWIVRLHTDNVVNTNGTLDKENKLVEWKVPFSQVIGGKDTIEMTAEISMGSPVLLYVAIGVGILLLVAVVVGVLLVKRSRARNQVPPPPPANVEPPAGPPSVDLPAQAP